ncbi:DUF7859 family protein [Halomarina litorea]|nr:hypothetical protein [Halomarina sp. BCD28]
MQVFGLDPVLLGILAVVLGIILALYLMFRRTMVAFREGYDDRRR